MTIRTTDEFLVQNESLDSPPVYESVLAFEM